MALRVLGLSAVVCLVAACGAETRSDGSGGSAGSGGTSGGGGTAGSGGSAGSGGTAGSGGNAGSGGATCYHPVKNVWVTVTPHPGDAGIVSYDWSTTGKVTASAKNELTIDDCPANGGCSASPHHVKLDAPLLDFVAPVGAFVSVHVVQHGGWIPARTLAIQNVPNWNGQPNPVASHDHFHLLAADGELKHPDAPFEVTTTLVPCPGDNGGKLYALSFTAPGEPPVTVPYGPIASVALAGQKWKASVVRSYNANAADYPAPYAWWFQGAE